jgi:capsular polysaccharide biosynthesis protein
LVSRRGIARAISILGRNAWVLVLAVFVGGLTGFAVAASLRTYTASAQLVILTSAASQTNPEDLARQQTLARGYVTLVRSDGVLGDAASELETHWNLDEVRSVAWLRDRVSASVGRDAFYLTIAASAADPGLAADIVNATANSFVKRVQAVQTQIQEPAITNNREGIASLTRQLDVVDAQIAAVEQTANVSLGDPIATLLNSTARHETLTTLLGLRTSLQARLDASNAELRTMLTRQKEGAVIWQSALPPERPEGPGLLSSSVAGAALAFLFAAASLLIGARPAAVGSVVGVAGERAVSVG